MGKLLDGRTRVYRTGTYTDIDIVVSGQWEGYVAFTSTDPRPQWEKWLVKRATALSEAVLGKGNARVDVDLGTVKPGLL